MTDVIIRNLVFKFDFFPFIYSQTAPKHSLALHTIAGPSDETTTLWRMQEDPNPNPLH
jgi:hypothetical protein